MKERKKKMFNKDKRVEYVNLIGDITYENANAIVNHLFQANKRNDAVVLCLSSGGGDVYAGMSIIETMKFVQVPVFTYAIGFVGSMAVNIFLEGEKKFVSPSASFMIHESNAEYSGDFDTIQRTLEFERYFDTHLNERIIANTSFTEDSLKKLLGKKSDVYFTPDKVLQHGFVENSSYVVKTQKELEEKIFNYLGN
jgi:ATP-dependent protease ClpP protease subunit